MFFGSLDTKLMFCLVYFTSLNILAIFDHFYAFLIYSKGFPGFKTFKKILSK